MATMSKASMLSTNRFKADFAAASFVPAILPLTSTTRAIEVGHEPACSCCTVKVLMFTLSSRTQKLSAVIPPIGLLEASRTSTYMQILGNSEQSNPEMLTELTGGDERAVDGAEALLGTWGG